MTHSSVVVVWQTGASCSLEFGFGAVGFVYAHTRVARARAELKHRENPIGELDTPTCSYELRRLHSHGAPFPLGQRCCDSQRKRSECYEASTRDDSR